jgi:DNA excision repair protein ERCC-3
MPPKRKRLNDDDEDDGNSKSNSRMKKNVSSASLANTQNNRHPVFDDDDILDSGNYHDYSKELTLKPDNDQRPIWISKDRLIFLEAFSPLYQQAYDFLVAIAEPEKRPEFIHTYRLTENSLNAAVAISIDANSILKVAFRFLSVFLCLSLSSIAHFWFSQVLNRLCKTNIPQEVISFIQESTSTFGKAKIVLKNNAYYIESKYPEVLRELLKNPMIATAREKTAAELAAAIGGGTSSEGATVVNGNAGSSSANPFLISNEPLEDVRNLDLTRIGLEMLDQADAEDEEGEDDDGNEGEGGAMHRFKTVSFMLKQGMARTVKRTAKDDSKYPLMEEYDFKNDHRNPNLSIDLRPSTKIRVSSYRCSVLFTFLLLLFMLFVRPSVSSLFIYLALSREISFKDVW